MKENLQTAIQRAIDEAPERGFVESIEISFTIKDVIPEIVNLSKNVNCIFSHQAGKIVMSQIQKK